MKKSRLSALILVMGYMFIPQTSNGTRVAPDFLAQALMTPAAWFRRPPVASSKAKTLASSTAGRSNGAQELSHLTGQPLWHEFRPGRFILDDRVALALNLAVDYHNVFLKAFNELPLKDKKNTAKQAELILALADKHKRDIPLLPGTLPGAPDDYSLFIFSVLTHPYLDNAGVRYHPEKLKNLIKPGAIFYPESFVLKASRAELEHLSIHEEHHSVWQKRKLEEPWLIGQMEEQLQMMLNASAQMPMPPDAERPENSLRALLQTFEEKYPFLPADEFWIRAVEPVVTDSHDPRSSFLNMSFWIRSFYIHFVNQLQSVSALRADELRASHERATEQRRVAMIQGREDARELLDFRKRHPTGLRGLASRPSEVRKLIPLPHRRAN